MIERESAFLDRIPYFYLDFHRTYLNLIMKKDQINGSSYHRIVDTKPPNPATSMSSRDKYARTDFKPPGLTSLNHKLARLAKTYSNPSDVNNNLLPCLVFRIRSKAKQRSEKGEEKIIPAPTREPLTHSLTSNLAPLPLYLPLPYRTVPYLIRIILGVFRVDFFRGFRSIDSLALFTTR